METQLVKKGVINELTIKEIEDLQDVLSIQLHILTDDGKRTNLQDLKKLLENKK